MTSPPRVQLVNKPASPRTGIGRYAHELERGLRERDIELRVAPLRRPIPRAAAAAGRRAGCDLDAFFRSYPLRAGVLPGYITHLTSQTLGILLLTQRLPRPVIITVHDILPYLLRHDSELCVYRNAADRLMDVLAMRGLRRADHLIAVSAYTKSTVVGELGLPPDRIDVVHSGVDTERFKPIPIPELFRERYKLPTDLRYVLYVGSEDPRKNLPILLRAFAIAQQDLPDLTLLKVGAPAFADQRSRHQRLCRELGIAAAVRWIDEVPEADLPLFYNVADVFAFPSRYEGFGFPVLEAMACGTPVVAARASSVPEIARDEVVWFSPDDIKQLAASLTRVVEGASDWDRLQGTSVARAKGLSWASAVEHTLAELVRSNALTERPLEAPRVSSPSLPRIQTARARTRKDKPSLKVLLVDNVVDTRRVGKSGHSDIIWDIATWIHESEMYPTIVGPYSGHDLPNPNIPFIQSRMPPLGQRNALGYCLVIGNIWRALANSLHDFDIIHTTDAFSCGIMSKIVRHVPIVLTTPGSIFEGLAAGNQRDWTATMAYLLVSRWAARGAARVHATSTDMAHWWEIAGSSSDRIVKIPLGVNTRIFRSAEHSRYLDGIPRILFVGRLVPENNVDLLVQSLAILKQRDIQFRALLAGDGRLRFDLEREVNTSGLSDCVEFLGTVDLASLPCLYQASDLLALPRCGGAPPRVMLQALACGTPVVAMNVGATRDYIQHEVTGLLCQPNSVTDFASLMQRMLDNPVLSKNMANAATGFVRESLSWDAVMPRLRDEVYLPAVAGTATAVSKVI